MNVDGADVDPRETLVVDQFESVLTDNEEEDEGEHFENTMT